MYQTVVTVCTAQWSLYVPHSDHYMYHQFNIQQFYLLLTQLYLCVLWNSEQTAIISLYNIKRLVFITETGCVYCAVRTESLNIIRVAKGQHSALFENEDCYCQFQ